MLYLAYRSTRGGQAISLDVDAAFHELDCGLYLIDSDLSRSKLYHRIKWAHDGLTALLVAPLADAPKFKGMKPGALTWLRQLNPA